MLSRIQMPVGFTEGLPLQQGHMYAWHAQVDTQTRPGWVARFFVPGPLPPPVFGGPVGPSTIPDIALPVPDSDPEPPPAAGR